MCGSRGWTAFNVYFHMGCHDGGKGHSVYCILATCLATIKVVEFLKLLDIAAHAPAMRFDKVNRTIESEANCLAVWDSEHYRPYSRVAGVRSDINFI